MWEKSHKEQYTEPSLLFLFEKTSALQRFFQFNTVIHHNVPKNATEKCIPVGESEENSREGFGSKEH